MLGQTKEQIQELIGKVQLLDFVIAASNNNHKEYQSNFEHLFKDVSGHKLKLLEEVARMSNVERTTATPTTESAVA